jgi:hypothetical protein
MGVREQVSRSQAAPAHFVQFFDSDESRHEAVASFLAEGYRGGSPIVVVARPRNSARILEHLERTVGPIQRDDSAGRILALDAADTLRRLSRSGSPDARLFEDVIVTPLMRVSRQGRIYAYGEMVDILAQCGDFDDALRLEHMWNRLLVRVDLTLMCGYSAAHFVSAGTENALRDVCSAHANVRVEAQDPLAAWLLEQAQ